jgi:hypothetical protein
MNRFFFGGLLILLWYKAMFLNYDYYFFNKNKPSFREFKVNKQIFKLKRAKIS